jgi:hypothetical protein
MGQGAVPDALVSFGAAAMIVGLSGGAGGDVRTAHKPTETAAPIVALRTAVASIGRQMLGGGPGGGGGMVASATGGGGMVLGMAWGLMCATTRGTGWGAIRGAMRGSGSGGGGGRIVACSRRSDAGGGSDARRARGCTSVASSVFSSM